VLSIRLEFSGFQVEKHSLAGGEEMDYCGIPVFGEDSSGSWRQFESKISQLYL
jgi:hypothetical protein